MADDQLSRRRVTDQRQVCPGHHVDRRLEHGVTDDLQPLAAHGRRRKREFGAGGLAEVDQPRVHRHHAHRCQRRCTPQRIDHDLGAAVGERLAERRLQIGVVTDVHDRVGAKPMGALQPLGVASRGHDPAGAQQPCRLHGDAADGAGCAQHQHPLARREPRPLLDRDPGRHAGDAERGGGDRIGIGRKLPHLRLVRHEPVGQRAACGRQRVDQRARREALGLDHAADALTAGRER